MKLDTIKDVPCAQTEFDIFPLWVYEIPVEGTKTGAAQAFFHKPELINIAEKAFGDLTKFKSLEIGPNEGEITFHLYNHGIRDLVSIETRSINYLKCLVVKNVLRLDTVRFMCGDAVLHLESNAYDICYCVGVFYHLPDPLKFVENLTKSCKRIALQTHYYEENAKVFDKGNLEAIEKSTRGNTVSAVNWNIGETEIFTVKGKQFHKIKHYYVPGDGHRIYGRGGVEEYAYMMKLEEIFKLFEVFGWEIRDALNDEENVRGPWVTMMAFNKNL
jgi:SAM-dependent methyltransferase